MGALLSRSGASLRKEEKIKQNQEGLDELEVFSKCLISIKQVFKSNINNRKHVNDVNMM